MSTPQTLTQTLPHQHLDHRQRFLPSPQDRFLPPPPPRPSSNLSNGYHNNIPSRPSSNLSNRQLPPPPPRPESSNSGYSHSHTQSRGGAEFTYAHGFAQAPPQEDSRHADSRSSYQSQRQLPPLQQPHSASASRASATGGADMPSYTQQVNGSTYSDDGDRGRRRKEKSPVDWVKYFGGKPPTEIIEIHDDDSPAPPATIQRPNPPATNDSSRSQHGHVDKKRRVTSGNGEVAAYSATNTPYSHSNGTSTDSLQNTTAPTSLGSTASAGSRVEAAQTGQKRKRTTRADEKVKQDTERPGPKGYLAEYGEYVPPPKQYKKQKEVVVPAIHEVCARHEVSHP